MRVLTSALAGMLLVAAMAGTALAGKPTIEYFANPEQFVYAAGEACDFAVQVDTLIQKEYGVTFTDAAGNPTKTIIHGRLVVKITNLSTGATVTLNESGPAVWTYNADGTISATLNGQAILVPPGVEFFEHSGPLHLLIGADGLPTLIDSEGMGYSACDLVG